MGYPYSHEKEVPILSKHFGDPEARTLKGWKKRGGYKALKKALGMSPEEVVKDLLERLRNRDEDVLLRGWSREELRAEIQKGLESGEPTPWNVDEFLEEAHARYKGQ